MNSDQTFQLAMALISIISILVGGTGATMGIKSSSKNKSFERELGEMKADIENQKAINHELKIDIRKGFEKMDHKINKLTELFIQQTKEGD